MGYRTQYFKYLWRYSCLLLRIHHGGSCTKSSNCSNKIVMPKSTTGCRIKSFLPIENMNIEKPIATKSSPNNFSKSLLNEFKRVHLCVARYRQHQCFLFCNDFCELLIITKDNLIDSWSIYNLTEKFLTH